MSATLLELRCRGCGWSEVCGPKEIARWLRDARKIRAAGDSDLAVLYELFRSTASQLVCRECGQTGMKVSTAVESGDWPGPASCAACSGPIPRERLEAIPGTKVCARCQHEADEGRPKQHKDFCPRCCAPMEIQVVQVGGRTRYVLRCSGTPPCI